ncbi:WXG100-like domain-containing protein [Gordonia sp. NPDC003424]
MKWPQGDETAMDRLHDDWTQFAHELAGIRAQLQAVSGGIGHSIEGDTQKAIDAQLNSILSGDESLARLIEQANAIADDCNTMSNELVVLKTIFIVELTALALYVYFLMATAEINWAAPGEIAQAIVQGRMTLTEAVDMVVRRILAKLLEKGIEEFASTSTKEMVELLGRDLAKDLVLKAAKSATTEGAKKLAFTSVDQVRDKVLWDKSLDPEDLVSKTVVSATVGAATAPIGHKVEELIGNRGDAGASKLVNKLGAGPDVSDPSALSRAGAHLVNGANWWGKDTLPGKVTNPLTAGGEKLATVAGLDDIPSPDEVAANLPKPPFTPGDTTP